MIRAFGKFHPPPRNLPDMNTSTSLFVVSAIGPDNRARIFGTCTSEDEADHMIAQLAAKLLLYRHWQWTPWQSGV